MGVNNQDDPTLKDMRLMENHGYMCVWPQLTVMTNFLQYQPRRKGFTSNTSCCYIKTGFHSSFILLFY